ncbi:MAG: hypothetical protein CMJ34_09290 [Phycisphaerae bacterium]|nr:hypothetical protein [Phycisphaerae bacterium]
MTETAAPHLVVVTGAASGIGRACVDLLTTRGCRVIALDIDESGLLARKAEAWSDADVRTVVADLRDPRSAIEAIEDRIEPGDRIDSLLNIAGIYEDTDPGNFDADLAADIIRVNLVAPHALSFGLWNRFSENACIVNAGSMSISRFLTGASAYTASKGGLAALTFSMQGTAGRSGPRVYCINFGRVRTPMIERYVSMETPAASPQEAAEEILACMTGRRRGREGRMYDFAPYEHQRRSSTPS